MTVVREIPKCLAIRLRHTIGSKPPDRRPVLQSDHAPVVEYSPFTAENVQF
jgi:hypothetical protein